MKMSSKYQTFVTFWDSQSIPVLTGQGGMVKELINPRQEYGAFSPLNPMTLVNAQNEKIRSSTHILHTRARTDISSFSYVSRDVYYPDYSGTYTEQYEVNDIEMVGQETRYMICHVTLLNTQIKTPTNVGNVVTAGTDITYAGQE